PSFHAANHGSILEPLDRHAGLPPFHANVTKPLDPRLGAGISREVCAEQRLARAGEQARERVVDVPVVAPTVHDGARVLDLVENGVEAYWAERQAGRHLLSNGNFPHEGDGPPAAFEM